MAQRPTGPLTSRPDRGPSPRRGWWAPVAQPIKRRWGLTAQDTRFAAATVPYLKTVIRSKGGCQRQEAPPAPVTAQRRHQLYHPIARTSLHRHCHSTAPTVAAPARIFTEEREIAGTSSSTGEGPLPLLSALSCKSRTCITGKEKKRRNPTDLLSDDPKVSTALSHFEIAKRAQPAPRTNQGSETRGGGWAPCIWHMLIYA